MAEIRKSIAELYPESVAFFQPADIVNQVLNFGVSAPIDIQIEGMDVYLSYDYATKLMKNLKKIPGLEDIALKQIFNYPALFLNVDRIKAAQVGINQRDISNSMLVSLSSSSLVAPSYFLNPNNNVNYTVVVKTPLENLSKISDILQTPITGSGSILESNLTSTFLNQPTQNPLEKVTVPLGNLSTVSTTESITANSHLNVQRVVDIFATPEGRDLGSVIKEIENEIKNLGELPK
jgi:Cu/Ag efflux pump CusA